MSITRRQFLLFNSAAAAGFILPSYLKKAELWLEKTSTPLLIPQAGATTNLYAIKIFDAYELRWGSPNINPPEMTEEEVYEYYFSHNYRNSDEYLSDHFGLEEDELDDFDMDAPADIMSYIDSWSRHESPTAIAYNYLESLDLGPILNGPGGVGEIYFIDGECPGNDYLGVNVPDDLSLSLLQERLNQLNQGVRIGLVY